LSRGNRPHAHERTAEERERDRLERERRRAERAGEAPPAEMPPEAVEPTSAPAAPEHVQPEPERVELAPAEPEPEPVLAEPVEAQAPPLDPPTEETHLEPEHTEPEHVEAEYIEPQYVEPEHDEDEAIGELPLPLPLPSPRRTIRIDAGARQGAMLDSGGSPSRRRGFGGGKRGAGAGGAGAGGGGSTEGGRRLTRARVAALVALALAVALVWFLVSLFQPFAGSGSGKLIVVIPKGASASKVGSILAKDGVVSSSFFFDLRATLDGKRGSLHSGRFELKHGMSYSAAIDALSKPPPKAIVVKVVIPEGYTRRQIAQLVAADSLSGDYLAASARSDALDPRDYGAPSHTPDLEGFLFPATYELVAGAPVQRLVEEQLSAFEERFTSEDARRARELHVTSYQLLIIASMVEREAQTAGDRPKIAAVIYNRLHEGMALGIDATIYYAVEQQKGIATYTGELTESQLKIDSPYNTRTHKGLPPTPISNPGSASIEAAAHPAHAPYLYYVAGADGCGEQVFSRTAAEFEKNVAAYDAAVKSNGGKPPTCKKK
jgi:UPF0755 protein